MALLNEATAYILGFKPYVLLPVILFVFSLILHIQFSKALKSTLTIGIGFIGIFTILGFFVANVGPAVTSLVARTGLSLGTLDVGWPPLAAMAWTFSLAPVLIVLFIVINLVMLAFKLTKTVNIDIWNFWHFIFLAQLVDFVTGSKVIAALAAAVISIITIKLADWSAPLVAKFSGLHGVSITTISGTAYFPIGLIGNRLLDKVPVIGKINADPDAIKKKFGLMGEPLVIGFVMGGILGAVSGYDFKKILELAFQIAAVFFLLPRMSAILGEGLMPVSDGIKSYIKKKFPHADEYYMGLDTAILLGHPAGITNALLLIMVVLILAVLLPGVGFIPLGDLANIIGAMIMVVVATRGNVVRSFIIGVPILVGKMYVATRMAQVYTTLAHEAKVDLQGYTGTITSFLDGGNVLRFWMFELSQGSVLAIAFVPVVAALLYAVRRMTREL